MAKEEKAHSPLFTLIERMRQVPEQSGDDFMWGAKLARETRKREAERTGFDGDDSSIDRVVDKIVEEMEKYPEQYQVSDRLGEMLGLPLKVVELRSEDESSKTEPEIVAQADQERAELARFAKATKLDARVARDLRRKSDEKDGFYEGGLDEAVARIVEKWEQNPDYDQVSKGTPRDAADILKDEAMSIQKTNKKPLKICADTSNFKEMVLTCDVFVDKSLFIEKIVDNGYVSILITRPHGWGKTLNLDMLKTFLELESKECQQRQQTDVEAPKVLCNRDLFTGGKIFLPTGEEKILGSLKISAVDSGEFMRYQGKYPVIFLSLKNVIGDSMEEMLNAFRVEINNLYKQHSYLLEYLTTGTKWGEEDLRHFQTFYIGGAKTATELDLEYSVEFLSKLLHKYHKQEVYVLIDDYDRPVSSHLTKNLGQANGEAKKLVTAIAEFISTSICSRVSKGNEHVKKLIMTGVFDATKKSSFGGCNNYGLEDISNIGFGEFFGFSDIEAKDLVTKLEFSNPALVLNKIKDWYSGYLIPLKYQQYMKGYTPLSIMKYLDKAYNTEDFDPESLWVQTGSREVLHKLLSNRSCENNHFSENLLYIAKHNSLTVKIYSGPTLVGFDWQADMYSEQFFFYLLLNLGYFTSRAGNNRDDILSIPNKELLHEFSSLISKDDEYCRDILYHLHKTSQIQILELIRQHDPEGIKKELSGSFIKCEDYSMNFNFFHLAAIFGNGEVYQTLLDSHCGKYSDFTNDKLNNLKPIDYAFILKNDQILKVMIAHYINHTDDLLKAPGWNESFFCFAFQSEAIQDLLTAILGDNTQQLLEKSCKKSSDYNKIDISTPVNFTSLKQFEKYLLEHDHAYVVVNSECNNLPETLVHLNNTIFINSFYSDEELRFTLCEPSLSKEEL